MILVSKMMFVRSRNPFMLFSEQSEAAILDFSK